MKKFTFLLLLTLLIVFLSYRYSERVYTYFLKIYYNKQYTETKLVNKARGMYNKKKYRELESFINPLILIYPENNEFREIAAFNYFMLGNPLKSAELLSGIAEQITANNRAFEEILKTLYDNKSYSELVYFYDKKIMRDNVNTAFYYGVALYKNNRIDESYNSLIYVKNNTPKLPEIYYYIGLNLDKKGKIAESASYIEEAYYSDTHNQAYKKALIESYRKLKLFRKAESLLRES